MTTCCPKHSAKRLTIDRDVTDRTIDFMRRMAPGDKPFFAFVPYTQTHLPVEPHPDNKGSTGNGHWADVLAQTDAYVGELLDVRLRLPIEGRRRFKGTLGSADGESIVIVVDDEPFNLPLRSIDRARAFPRLDINQGKN